MSMLSAQIDELRKLAEYYDGSEVASLMCDAADTIWQLRDDLQRTNAENARLRKQAARAWRLFLKHGAVHSCDLLEVDAVRDELRKLGVEVYG